MKKLFCRTLPLLALLALGGCATPEYRAMLQAEAEAKAKLECRQVRTTGSNLNEERCRTSEAWAQQESRQQREAAEYKRSINESSVLVSEPPVNTAFGAPTQL